METELLHTYTSTVSSIGSQISRSPSLRRLSFILPSGQDEIYKGISSPEFKRAALQYRKSFLISDNDSKPVNLLSKGGGGKDKKWKFLKKKLPILSWIRTYTMVKFLSDVIAGATVGLALIPQALAIATIAELRPKFGLYSSYLGCFVYIFLGSTKSVSVGPTPILAVALLEYAQRKPPEYIALLTFLTGLVTFALGFFHLGFLANFLSTPVTSGFTSAAALNICAIQMRALLGLKVPAGNFLEVSRYIFRHLGEIRANDILISVICVVVLLFLKDLQSICTRIRNHSSTWKHIFWWVSTQRGALVLAITATAFFIHGREDVVNLIGIVRGGLPSPILPPFNFTIDSNNTKSDFPLNEEWMNFTIGDFLREDVTALIVIPFLALTEHVAAAKISNGPEPVDINQELLSVGVANILGTFMFSMPVCGVLSRTGVNKAAGVQSPMGGLVTGVMVIITLQFLTPMFYFVPRAALASTIFCGAIFSIDWDIIYPMWKSKKMDLLPLIATFLISLSLGLHYGVLLGLATSVLFLLHWAAWPSLRVKKGETERGSTFLLLEVDRSLTFPSIWTTIHYAWKARRKFAKRKDDILPVVIDCRHLHFADYTAAQGILRLFQAYKEAKHPLLFYNLKPSLREVLLQGGISEEDMYASVCENEKNLERKIEALERESNRIQLFKQY